MKNDMIGINKKSIKGEKKYTKLLNNLLAIKGRDQAIFTKVNNVESFDVYSKFSKSISYKILNQNIFSLILEEQDLKELVKLVSLSNSGEEIIEMYEKYNQKLFNTKKILLLNQESFYSTKNELLEKLKEQIQKEKIRWKQFRRKILDSNIQDNIWPLHVATMFVSIQTLNKNIYAPLLLKEVSLNIKDDETIQLKSEGSWKINEKIIFLLSEAGLPINTNSFDQEDEIEKIIQKILFQLNLNKIDIQFNEKFDNKKNEDIKNKVLEFHSGVVLGLFKPAGGNIRKTMIKIIENNEIDEILDSDPNKNKYKERINNFIINNSKELIRIQASNFSQDKALISSLIQDTVIWGPPGTGKSQVIANIIANILKNENTAVVMSQKKAALDVLKKRLGKISPFVLFILNDNKMDKSEFYKPLKNFIDMIENNTYIPVQNIKKIIEETDLEILEIISKTKREGKYKNSLKVLEILNNENNLVKNLFNLDFNIKYPFHFNSSKEFCKELMNLNKIKLINFFVFTKIPKKVKNICHNAEPFFLNKKINLNELIEIAKTTDYETIKKLQKCVFLDKKENNYISDEKFLAAFLSKKILKMIEEWKVLYNKNYLDYKRFANAVRAERRLPFKFMNDHINIIKLLFPVIITTPETNFINWDKKHFDYAILDESSQIFLEIGLPILYLAKTKILAGDTEQMQPSSWFTTRDEIEEFEEEDVAENADSLLQYALDKGIYKIMLDKNYRSSSANLMSFSSKEFYNSKLDVIDNKEKKQDKSIEIINVNGVWESGINIIEKDKVLEVAYKEIEKYNSMIILTFNSNQRQLIEKEILEYHPILCKKIEEEKLSIRNIENIQGDEADIVIISVIYDCTTNIGSTYVARNGGKNALNVAISRAKDKMIVIKSLTYKTLKNSNSSDFIMFRKWLEFLDMTEAEQKAFSKQGKNKLEESYGETESKFEREVIEFLKENILTVNKMKLIKQFEVGSYSIDIALINDKNEFILGIEVDGYNYHDGQGFEKYLDDLSRQEFLENKGYNIYRIKEISFKLEKNKIIDDLKTLI